MTCKLALIDTAANMSSVARTHAHTSTEREGGHSVLNWISGCEFSVRNGNLRDNHTCHLRPN